MAGKDNAAAGQQAGLSEEMVRDYLQRHPDFLQRNPDLLYDLHVSHATGSAVSLVEKQVSVLRERNVEMRRRLNTLTSNARENQQIYERTRNLLLALLEADDLAGLKRAFLDAMEHEFQVERASFILFGDTPATNPELRVVSSEEAHASIGPLLRGHKAVCSVLRKEELGFLFPDAGEVGSAAVVPLRGQDELGVIAVGSSDAGRYSGYMETLFLNHIAEVLARLIPRLAQEPESA
jgi:uncharacterized protein YigA (DUF484 family)